MGGVGASGATRREAGVADVTQCDRSPWADWRGWISSWVADLLGSLEERLWRLARSSRFPFVDLGELGGDSI